MQSTIEHGSPGQPKRVCERGKGSTSMASARFQDSATPQSLRFCASSGRESFQESDPLFHLCAKSMGYVYGMLVKQHAQTKSNTRKRTSYERSHSR